MTQIFNMNDVEEMNASKFRALAQGKISVSLTVIEMINGGNSSQLGALEIAKMAGIMASKNTSPSRTLSRFFPLDSTQIWFDSDETSITAHCEVICHGNSSVEMEALAGVSAALLSIFEFAKEIDSTIEISNILISQKEDGKSEKWQHPGLIEKKEFPESWAAKISFKGMSFAVVTLSDRASQGQYKDDSGSILREYFKSKLAKETFYEVIPDDKGRLQSLISKAVESKTDIVLLTGGTGLSQRDITPEAIKEIASKELSGLGELQRQYGSQFTKSAWLSRSSAYLVGETLVILFPGSPKAVLQGLKCIGDLIPHAVQMIRGERH